MKKLLILAALICIAVPAFATDATSTSADVYITITPHISVSAPSAAVTLVGGTMPAGLPFSIPVVFTVHANMEQLKLGAGASILYKGDIPTSVNQIALSTGGISIVPDAASPMAVHPSNVAAYDGSSEVIGGFTVEKTEFIPFESSTNNTFSQNVTVTPSWLNNDSELPIGEYSGKVAFYVMANI